MENEKFTRKNTQDNFITEKFDIIENNLLGSYDDKGNYVIAPQIVNELISLKKVKKSTYDNSMFCFGNLMGYGEICFELHYDQTRDVDNLATASLFVLEDVHKINGYLQNTIKTKLAQYTDKIESFLSNSYVKFNIVEDDEDSGQEKKSLDDLELDNSYILAKKAYMLLLEKLSEDKMLDAYGKLFTAKLSIMTKLDNDFSQDVLNRFNEKYQLIENIFLKNKNYKDLNELLDACIEEVSGTKDIYLSQEEEFNKRIEQPLSIFISSIDKLNDNIEQKAMNLLDKDDRSKLEQMNDALEQTEFSENNSRTDSGENGIKEIINFQPETEIINDITMTQNMDKNIFGQEYNGSSKEESSEDKYDSEKSKEETIKINEAENIKNPNINKFEFKVNNAQTVELDSKNHSLDEHEESTSSHNDENSLENTKNAESSHSIISDFTNTKSNNQSMKNESILNQNKDDISSKSDSESNQEIQQESKTNTQTNTQKDRLASDNLNKSIYEKYKEILSKKQAQNNSEYESATNATGSSNTNTFSSQNTKDNHIEQIVETEVEKQVQERVKDVGELYSYFEKQQDFVEQKKEEQISNMQKEDVGDQDEKLDDSDVSQENIEYAFKQGVQERQEKNVSNLNAVINGETTKTIGEVIGHNDSEGCKDMFQPTNNIVCEIEFDKTL